MTALSPTEIATVLREHQLVDSGGRKCCTGCSFTSVDNAYAAERQIQHQSDLLSVMTRTNTQFSRPAVNTANL